MCVTVEGTNSTQGWNVFVVLSGLTVLKADEVYDIMERDYPDKFKVFPILLNLFSFINLSKGEEAFIYS